MPPSIPFGGLGLTLISCCLTATVLGNAYYQKKQFYPSVVYITKSNPSMAAIYLMAFTLVILFGKLLKKIFFGTLRAAESEHLIERFFYAVTETCLAFTVFRDDFSPKFVALFTVLLFLKAFHWLADYRVDYMERSPVITRIFHIRVASLLILLSAIDILLVRHAYHSTMSLGASVQLVFGFEYAILMTVVYNIGVKYICHSIDLQSENPWENKAMYLLYTELFVGFIKVLLYLAFLFIMVRIHTFPLFIIRPMYLTMKSFKKAFQDILQSRRAIHNMNTQYPNASEEDLRESDNVCIICRDEMVLNTGVKKLPCNHLFHAICLRSWFQRQQTCPTCRLDVLRPTPTRAAAGAATATPNAAANNNNNAANNNNNQGQQPQDARRPPQQFIDFMQHMMEQAQQRNNNQANNQTNAPTTNPPTTATPNPPPPVMVPPMAPFPFLPPQLLQHIRNNAENQTSTSTGQSSTSSTTTAGPSVAPNFSMPLPPFSPMMMGGLFTPPPAPRDYGPLTKQELEDMEGREREHITRRLEALSNINILISAAHMQLTQYNALMSSLDIKMPLPPKTQNTSPSTETSSDSSKSKPSTSNSNVSNSPPSTSKTSDSPVKSEQTLEQASTSSTSPTPGAETDIAESSNSPESSESTLPPGSVPQAGATDDTAEEVRRRRLEHFVASSH